MSETSYSDNIHIFYFFLAHSLAYAKKLAETRLTQPRATFYFVSRASNPAFTIFNTTDVIKVKRRSLEIYNAIEDKNICSYILRRII